MAILTFVASCPAFFAKRREWPLINRNEKLLQLNQRRRGRRPVFRIFAQKPAIILPGLGNSSEDYRELQRSLADREIPSYVLPVSRVDWLRNAKGLFQRSWWRGKLEPRPILDWYFLRLQQQLEDVRDQHNNCDVNLIGHSAGGWLARVFMGEFTREGVSSLISLGSPHLAPPDGTLDQTRGLLRYVNTMYPGAYFDDINYICLAGKDTEGKKWGQGTFNEWFAGVGYRQVCGLDETWGDFVVPVDSALLEGANNIILEGVFHSPVGASETRPWYGSKSILDTWIHHLE